jgi:hypothetical protein
MPVAIEVEATLHAKLVVHLRSSETEEVAFLAGRPDVSTSTIDVFEMLAVPAEDLPVKTAYHLRLADHARAGVISWAHERSAILIEAHAHRSGRPAEFSASDLWGLEDWVPHVRWRLANRPYVALIFGDDSFDGLVWQGDDKVPVEVAGLYVGDEFFASTGLTFRQLNERQGYRR